MTTHATDAATVYAQGGGMVIFNPADHPLPVPAAEMPAIPQLPTAAEMSLEGRVEAQTTVEVEVTPAAQLEVALAGIAEGVLVGSPRNLAVSDGVRAQLHTYNLEMRQIEAMMIHMDGLRADASEPMKEAITRKHHDLRDRYNDLLDEKIAYVKGNVRAEDQVFAMSVPRHLESGTVICSAARRDRVESWIRNGFNAPDLSKPSTMYGNGWVNDGWGGKEMGEIGYYFSKDTIPYLSNDRYPCGLQCSLRNREEGAAIMSVSELRARDFSPAQIEGGYQRLRQEYPFIQNDGLPPKDTEIVLFDPRGKVEFQQLMIYGGPALGATAVDIDMFFDPMGETEAPELHETWQAPAIVVDA